MIVLLGWIDWPTGPVKVVWLPRLVRTVPGVVAAGDRGWQVFDDRPGSRRVAAAERADPLLEQVVAELDAPAAFVFGAVVVCAQRIEVASDFLIVTV